MKIMLFIALFFSGIHFIPDAWVEEFVKHNIPISGDGEDAMDSFYMHVIVIKTVMCGLGAWLLLTLIYWFRNRLKK